MEIKLQNVGRRFNRDWVFRGIDHTFYSGTTYAVLGPNGSGKSTLLQVVAGSLAPSEGQLEYYDGGTEIDPSRQFQQVSFAAPYMELVEELTLGEQIAFYFKFKPYAEGVDAREIIRLLGLHVPGKQIRNFSSGMKQRTRLALALCARTPVLFLDEPTSNLDREGVTWYNIMLERFSAKRIVIIGSNQEQEYEICDKKLLVTDFK